MAEALVLLPNIGYVRVLKLADGENRAYRVPSNEIKRNRSSSTSEVAAVMFVVWEWEITFVGGDGTNLNLPLMAAVWSNGRTQPSLDEGKEGFGRPARFVCDLCEAYPNESWPSAAEKAVGPRMEVSRLNFLAFPMHHWVNLRVCSGV